MMQDLVPMVPAGVARPRVALLVDGDNLSPDRAAALLQQAARRGEVRFRRVYGNAVNPSPWTTTPGFSFRYASVGKNATDLLMSVEAMALMLGGKADVLMLATSDGDFTHVATALREEGFEVIGTGEGMAPEGFRKACSRFEELSVREPVPAAPAKPRVVMSALEATVVAMIRSEGDLNGCHIGRLGGRMGQAHPGLTKERDQKNWRVWLLARPHLFHCDPKGPLAKVRALTRP